MLHNDAAQQRPDKMPTLAPEASQKPPQAQGRANLTIPTLQRMNSRPGDTTAASLTDGNMDTPHIIHIHGRHSPPPRLDPTPHSTKSTLQQPHGPAKIMRQKPKLLAWLAQYHPFGEGHEQARSEHKEKPVNTQATTTAQYTHSPLLKSCNRPMAAARRRQGQQLYAWYGTPSRRPQAASPFPLTPAGEAIQLQPPDLPPEAWPCECNTNKAKQPKRDKVFLNTTRC